MTKNTSTKVSLLTLTVTVLLVQGLAQKTPVIRVKSGKLRGIVSSDSLRGYYNSYFGIPYGKAERFQASKPVRWKGILEAKNTNVQCSQKLWLPFAGDIVPVHGKEDCLTLNVYTPTSNAYTRTSERLNSLKPVMVFIHGGGFRDGSSSYRIYGPQYLLRHDVIVVSINYRLDVLGFLCLGIKEAPGNIGLKDQVEALKWIKDNIEAFGGDPGNITLFGESAGSASVMYHLMSSMSEGLYNKVIMQSGSAASFWSFQFEPIKTASLLAKQLGYDTEDPQELYNIFVNKSAEELLRTPVPRKNGDIVQSENIFVPCAEKELPGIREFITESPHSLLSKGKYSKVPIIIGYNNKEGYMFAGKENDNTISNINFYDSLPRDLKFPSEEEARTTAAKLQELYLGRKKHFSRNTMMELSNYEGELGIIFPVIAATDVIMKTNDKDTYVYKFSYDGLLNLAKIEYGFGEYPGASHGDDLMYLFKPTLTDLAGLLERDIIVKMTAMWTNFAKFGNPTPEESNITKWNPITKENPTVLVIDREFSLEPLWDSDRIRFLNDTYTLYRRLE